MAKRLVDSDILIDHINGRLPQMERFSREARAGLFVIAMISRFEVLAGARDDIQFARIARFLRGFHHIPFDAPAADAAARIDYALRAEGLRLAPADALIAGIAVSRGLPLVTRNRRHFGRVPRLEIEDF